MASYNFFPSLVPERSRRIKGKVPEGRKGLIITKKIIMKKQLTHQLHSSTHQQLNIIKPRDRSPEVISKQFVITSIEQAMELSRQKNIPTFGKLSRTKGGKFSESVMIFWLINLNEFIYGNDKAKALTLKQIEMTAEILIERYEVKNLTITDLSLIFRKAFSGEYGKLYGRLRPDIIIDWFLTYFEERVNVAEHISIQKHQKTKSFLSHVPRGVDDKTEMKEQFKKANLWYLQQDKPPIIDKK